MSQHQQIDQQRIQAAVREFLLAIGEDPEREGLRETPERVARATLELMSGLAENPAAHLLKQFHDEAAFDAPKSADTVASGDTVYAAVDAAARKELPSIVIVKDIPFYSVCEHHLLPFIGKAHVAYIPRDGRITGLSKLARCVNGYARRPQVQERLTAQIANALVETLNPHAVLVLVEAEHTCMTMRGIKAQGSLTRTRAVRGAFCQDASLRAEALELLKN